MTFSDKIKGVLYAVIAAATYGMIPLFAKPLYVSDTNPDGLNPDSVLIFRYLFAIIILGVMIKQRGRSFSLKKKEILPLVAMGAVMSLSSLTLFGSYQYMDGGIASTILFVYPIIVAVIMALFFKEKITLSTAICIFFALWGIYMLYNGDNNVTLSLRGTILVLLSALFYAIYIVSVNRSALKHIPTLKLTFYMLLFGIIMFVVRVNTYSEFIIPTKSIQWLCLFSLALFPTAISFICTTKAVQHIGATSTAILGAIEPFTAIFIGVMVFSEVLTPRICLGLAMIIVAVTIVVAGGNIKIRMNLIRFKKMFPRLNRKNNNNSTL